jgi:hypothetical protein
MYTKEPNEERQGRRCYLHSCRYSDNCNIALGLFPSFILDLLA